MKSRFLEILVGTDGRHYTIKGTTVLLSYYKETQFFTIDFPVPL